MLYNYCELFSFIELFRENCLIAKVHFCFRVTAQVWSFLSLSLINGFISK